ncbi:unnamed protein product [Symbiodinium microadriaticum]|nr:unnamed protein product [Symbiodinium microadriaticum]
MQPLASEVLSLAVASCANALSGQSAGLLALSAFFALPEVGRAPAGRLPAIDLLGGGASRGSWEQCTIDTFTDPHKALSTLVRCISQLLNSTGGRQEEFLGRLPLIFRLLVLTSCEAAPGIRSRSLYFVEAPPPGSGIDASRLWKYFSVCSVNGEAVAVPGHGEKILVVDAATGQASAIDLPAGIDASRLWKYESVCSVNGKAVAVPGFGDKILVVDPATGQASAIDLPAGIDASREWKYESVCSVNGKAVAVPRDAEKILVVDAATGQASAIDLPAGIVAGRGWKYMSVCNVNGKAVAVPSDAEKILIVELPQSTVFSLSLHQSAVQHTPVFAELVAALLSYWV